MKFILILAALSLLSTAAMADRHRHRHHHRGLSDLDISTIGTSAWSYTTASDREVIIYKEDVKLVVEDAIEVLQGLPASDEFMELHLKLEDYTGDSMTEVEAARLIIQMSQDV